MSLDLTPKKKLGEILFKKGIVTEDQITEAIQIQHQQGKRLGLVFLEKEWVTEKQMVEVLSEQFSLPKIWLRPGIYDPAALKLIDKATAKRLEILPLIKLRNILSVATHDPQAIHKFDEIEQHTGLKVIPVLAPLTDIKKYSEEAYSGVGLVTVDRRIILTNFT